jgi:beta-lactamase superfamily II metal-dependent hydrolase
MILKVAFLDCRGHGDCAVITFEEKGTPACIVIDGGEYTSSANALADYLDSQNVETIDLMVGTHIDQDHINGLKIFVQKQLEKKQNNEPYVEVKEYWGPLPSEEYVSDIVPSFSPEIYESSDKMSWQQYVIKSVGQNDNLYSALQELGASIKHPALDDIPDVPFEDVKMELLGPDTQIPADRITAKALGHTSSVDFDGSITTLEELENAVAANYEKMAEEAKRNANNQSIVFRLSPAVGHADAKKWSFLFTGDAEEESWAMMLGNTSVAPRLKSRVLKIPHHGSSENGITEQGVKKVRSEYSVNLVGQKHGLPDKETLKLIRDEGSKLFCPKRNQSSSHKSACFSVPKSKCQAKDNPKDVIFAVDTISGECTITPEGRRCLKEW